MLSPGQVIPLTIEKPAAGGWMIARVDGEVVLVGGTIPGELVRARITKIGKGVAWAETLHVDRASPDRRAPFTDPACGGCLYAHVAYPAQLALKSAIVADAFARIGRLDLPAPPTVRPSPEDAYRMRARLHVRGSRAGFFREGTHTLCDARATRQLLPATADAVDAVAAALAGARIDGVTEIELSENADASDRAIALVSARSVPRRLLDGVAAISGLSGTLVASGDSPMPLTISGSAYVVDVVNAGSTQVRLRRHVLAFFQGNRYLLQDLVDHVVGLVEPETEVIDFYAGTGIFAVTAAVARGARVTAVEGDRFGAADLAANAVQAGDAVRAVHQPVETFCTMPATGVPSTVIVDPPRTGMSRDALSGVIKAGAARLVYVSCDVATLARDSRKIVDAGYRLERIDAFDLFPNTPHVETVVSFERS